MTETTSLLLASGRHRRAHDLRDGVDELTPPRLLAEELLLALRRQPVELGALIRIGLSPLRGYPTFLREPLQGGIQRTGFDLQHVGRLRANRLSDRVAVLRSPLQGAEDQHVEGAVEKVGARVGAR